jgi:flavin reductase (DIM6/NTAB) family NADH-FMN oxidoreductase RutF
MSLDATVVEKVMNAPGKTRRDSWVKVRRAGVSSDTPDTRRIECRLRNEALCLEIPRRGSPMPSIGRMTTSTALPCTPEAFRKLMGRFTTGVGVVMATDEAGVVGMTVNSLTSVSLQPMLLLFCTRLGSASAERVLRAERFTVNLLQQEQLPASNYFAGAREGTATVEVEEDGHTAWIPHSNAVFVCKTHSVYPAGDHHIVVAHVDHLMGPEAAAPPLVYHEGRYAQIATRS